MKVSKTVVLSLHYSPLNVQKEHYNVDSVFKLKILKIIYLNYLVYLIQFVYLNHYGHLG